MAFSYTVDTTRSVHGNHRVVTGTWTNTDTDSGGDVVTSLDYIFGFLPTPTTSHVGATMPKYSVSGGTATLVTDNGVDGNWIAWGR